MGRVGGAESVICSRSDGLSVPKTDPPLFTALKMLCIGVYTFTLLSRLPTSTTPIRRSAAIVLSRYNSSSTSFRDGQEDIGNTVLDETFVPRREGTITRKQKLGGMISYYERDAA